MRVLMVYGSDDALRRATVHMITTSPVTTRNARAPFVFTVQSVTNPADVVQGIVISSMEEAERVRGLFFDLVIEHESFDPAFGGHDREPWRTFVMACVLSRV